MRATLGAAGPRHVQCTPPRLCAASQHGSLASPPRANGEQQADIDASPSTSEPKLSLADPAGAIVWGGRLPSKRRLALGGLAATSIVLGGNLGGLTSMLLGLDGGHLAGRLHVDVLVPVRGFKRCFDTVNGFEFVYPASWLADYTVLYRTTQRAEAARALDPPAPARSRPAQRRSAVEPIAAFGPPRSSGEENVSVVVAPIMPGFTLGALGGPDAAGRFFLDSIVAPPGSNKSAQLLGSAERRDASGVIYYQLEFKVSGPNFSRHNVAVLVARRDTLFTFNAQCPDDRWEADGAALRAAADSFSLLIDADR